MTVSCLDTIYYNITLQAIHQNMFDQSVPQENLQHPTVESLNKAAHKIAQRGVLTNTIKLLRPNLPQSRKRG